MPGDIVKVRRGQDGQKLSNFGHRHRRAYASWDGKKVHGVRRGDPLFSRRESKYVFSVFNGETLPGYDLTPEAEFTFHGFAATAVSEKMLELPKEITHTRPRVLLEAKLVGEVSMFNVGSATFKRGDQVYLLIPSHKDGLAPSYSPGRGRSMQDSMAKLGNGKISAETLASRLSEGADSVSAIIRAIGVKGQSEKVVQACEEISVALNSVPDAHEMREDVYPMRQRALSTPEATAAIKTLSDYLSILDQSITAFRGLFVGKALSDARPGETINVFAGVDVEEKERTDSLGKKL